MAIDTLLGLFVGGSLLAFIGTHLAAWSTYRDLVDYQFLVAREAWERAGRPAGGEITRQAVGFWNLPNVGAAGAQLEEWDVKRPEWMVGDLRAITTYRLYRRWRRLNRIAAFLAFASIAAFAVAVGQW